MSGREPEPVAAFFPAIDRNLIRDLDRHLRNAAPPAAEKPNPPAAATAGARPSTSDILDAVEHAASSMSAMTGRIQDLETKNRELETMNHQLRSKLGELLHSQQTFDARFRTETERAAQAEQLAAHHAARSQGLERDLETALGDLTRIAEAITTTLGSSSLHQD